LEHNVYYALTTSDEYVWCYSERMNWWTSASSVEPLTPEKVEKDRILPPGVEEALISARQKYEHGKPLGYNIKDMIEAARLKRKSKQK
jgi:hypothetical protein